MTVAALVERLYLRVVDAVMAHLHQPTPADAALRRCRLISHRGEHDNRRIMENSLAAFERAAAAGVWGVECDVRWTGDGVPVLSHDADLERLYGAAERIDQLTFARLRARFPALAGLAELVERFGGRLHLMVEFKAEPPSSATAYGSDTLDSLFSGLRPGTDFHFLTLNPRSPALAASRPARTWVPIAAGRPDTLCRVAPLYDWDGVCGHYSLMSTARIQRLRHCGKMVGTGYADSTNCLFRELNRGVNWIFSNRAAAMQTVVNQLLHGKQA